MDRDLYGTDGTDPEEATGLLEAEDTLEDPRRPRDLDTGWSPPERPWGVADWGTTEREEATGESLAGRLARELPDRSWDDADGDGLGDLTGGDGELLDDEVGDARAGRLAEVGDDGVVDREDELLGEDLGIDGGAASAEEAAVHLVRRGDD
ncbi:DUF5709 domain-containing protein [Geodermatophilus arenarius]|uniref:DUF5709 domain-containing protein n=1 Tax=Geodermatophilus arenarius TaxID=1137990 RepID=A0ABV9LM34_9ACTN